MFRIKKIIEFDGTLSSFFYATKNWILIIWDGYHLMLPVFIEYTVLYACRCRPTVSLNPIAVDIG